MDTANALHCEVRWPNGEIFAGPLPARQHRRIQLEMLHGSTDGFVEVAYGRRPPGKKLDIYTRLDPEHFLPGGASGSDAWLDDLLALADDVPDGEEAFVGAAPRQKRRGRKANVCETRILWVDIDGGDDLGKLWTLLERKPAHLVVESAGSGGMHAYWALREPLAAMKFQGETDEIVEWIERANKRLITPVDGDRACADRGRVMRLAGTVNHKTGRHARVVRADMALAPYDVRALVGDLPDPAGRVARRVRVEIQNDDPYRRIPGPEYFLRIAGREVPDRGRVRCPHRDHEDRDPSCNVHDVRGWYCYGCGRGGGIYDLASAVLGGPTGSELAGDAFLEAKRLVVDTFGTRDDRPRPRTRRTGPVRPEGKRTVSATATTS